MPFTETGGVREKQVSGEVSWGVFLGGGVVVDIQRVINEAGPLTL